jgi:hypothetical protein
MIIKNILFIILLILYKIKIYKTDENINLIDAREKFEFINIKNKEII